MQVQNDFQCFVVVTAGRSGSNFLCDALRTHPGILCFNELLEDPDQSELEDKGVVLRTRRARETPSHYCDEVVFRRREQFSAVGFKAKCYHMGRNRLAHYFKSRECKIIHSRRRNHLAQSLSVPLAESNEAWSSLDGDEGRYADPIRIDVQEILARARWIAEEERRVRAMFSGHLPMLDVYYEDLCHADRAGQLTRDFEVNRILDFLGANRCALATGMKKQRKRPYSELIVNLAELRSVLRRRSRLRAEFDDLELAL